MARCFVCLGDSLTAGSGVSREACWVSLLDAETPDNWQNAGIPGDTLPGMTARLQGRILRDSPYGVLILGGVNDMMLTGSPELAKPYLFAMVNQCAAAGVRPIVGIPYRVSGLPAPWDRLCHPNAFAALAAYTDWLRELVRATGLRFVDFGAAVSREMLQPDGLHPSGAGHRAMAEAVKRAGL